MFTQKICPNCGSKDSAVPVEGEIGKFVCSVCGYSGKFNESEIVGREMEGEDGR